VVGRWIVLISVNHSLIFNWNLKMILKSKGMAFIVKVSDIEAKELRERVGIMLSNTCLHFP
jgi:hypothetical protein